MLFLQVVIILNAYFSDAAIFGVQVFRTYILKSLNGQLEPH